jgi:hypothetical protein
MDWKVELGAKNQLSVSGVALRLQIPNVIVMHAKWRIPRMYIYRAGNRFRTGHGHFS